MNDLALFPYYRSRRPSAGRLAAALFLLLPVAAATVALALALLAPLPQKSH